MPLLYHVAAQEDWTTALNKGSYAPEAFAKEGFIHISTRGQLEESLKLHFGEQQQVFVLIMSERLLKPNLKWEHSESRGQDFPHYYARLKLELIENVAEVERKSDGSWDLSEL